MKYVLVLMLSVLTVISCNDYQAEKMNREKQKPENAIGGAKDEHGCLTAAGYTWSELKQDCIRIFEDGKRLNAIHQEKNEAIPSVFIVFSEDRSTCELFLPNKKDESLILQKSKNGLYTSQNYTYDDKKSALYIDDTITYENRK